MLSEEGTGISHGMVQVGKSHDDDYHVRGKGKVSIEKEQLGRKGARLRPYTLSLPTYEVLKGQP